MRADLLNVRGRLRYGPAVYNPSLLSPEDMTVDVDLAEQPMPVTTPGHSRLRPRVQRLPELPLYVPVGG